MKAADGKDLPTKQKRVVTLLAQGKKPAEIAKSMGTGVHNVYGHMRRIEKAGIDLSAFRSRNGSSRKSVSTNGATPSTKPLASVKHTLDMLAGEKTNLDEEADRIDSQIAENRHLIEQAKASIDRNATERKRIDKARAEIDKTSERLKAV